MLNGSLNLAIETGKFTSKRVTYRVLLCSPSLSRWDNRETWPIELSFLREPGLPSELSLSEISRIKCGKSFEGEFHPRILLLFRERN